MKTRTGTIFSYLFPMVFLFILSGCAVASVARYPNANYPPTSPKNVAVYTNYPPVEYEVIGEIGGSGNAYTSWQQVATEMRKKAAEIGGSAVVILAQDTPYVGSIVTPGSIQGNTYGSNTATGNLNAYGAGNNVYGNYTGSGTSQTTSNYTYTPPSAIPMYGKIARGVVLRYKSEQPPPAEDMGAKQRKNDPYQTKYHPGMTQQEIDQFIAERTRTSR